MKIGIIREGKIPPDTRVPLTPAQCRKLREELALELIVQCSETRCYSDSEYAAQNVPLVASVEDCDILLGVKEVPIPVLLADKTYFFFSHTIKAQPYNRDLLRTVLDRNISLIDYEVLTNDLGQRLIAFGKFAGMVGAHNALWTYGTKQGNTFLPRMKDCLDYAAIREIYATTDFPRCRIVLTGTGRVANGAALVLDDMGFARISPDEFRTGDINLSGYTQLGVTEYARHNSQPHFAEEEYFEHPEHFHIDFSPFYTRADILINGIYWDPKAPAFFSAEEMRLADFKINTIADVTCDIAPESSIPSTLHATTIADPVFGYRPTDGAVTEVDTPGSVAMMTIDNLPNELPCDASEAFGQQFIDHIIPEILKSQSEVLKRGTIATAGKLTDRYQHLSDYVN